jgi:hypothetical protein
MNEFPILWIFIGILKRDSTASPLSDRNASLAGGPFFEMDLNGVI